MADVRKTKINGYDFGDRQLEGVIFEVVVDVGTRTVKYVDCRELSCFNPRLCNEAIKACESYVQSLIDNDQWDVLGEKFEDLATKAPPKPALQIEAIPGDELFSAKTLDEASKNPDGTYDGAKALSWLSNVMFPGSGVPEEEVKEIWEEVKRRKKK